MQAGTTRAPAQYVFSKRSLGRDHHLGATTARRRGVTANLPPTPFVRVSVRWQDSHTDRQLHGCAVTLSPGERAVHALRIRSDKKHESIGKREGIRSGRGERAAEAPHVVIALDTTDGDGQRHCRSPARLASLSHEEIRDSECGADQPDSCRRRHHHHRYRCHPSMSASPTRMPAPNRKVNRRVPLEGAWQPDARRRLASERSTCLPRKTADALRTGTVVVAWEPSRVTNRLSAEYKKKCR